MRTKYYLDTCIWRDFYENRYSLNNFPLGKYASLLFMKLIKEKHLIIFSNLTYKELSIDYNKDEINEMLSFLYLTKNLLRVDVKKEDYSHAKDLAQEREIPLPDVVHALVSKRADSILITQDKHFYKNIKKPQDLV